MLTSQTVLLNVHLLPLHSSVQPKKLSPPEAHVPIADLSGLRLRGPPRFTEFDDYDDCCFVNNPSSNCGDFDSLPHRSPIAPPSSSDAMDASRNVIRSPSTNSNNFMAPQQQQQLPGSILSQFVSVRPLHVSASPLAPLVYEQKKENRNRDASLQRRFFPPSMPSDSLLPPLEYQPRRSAVPPVHTSSPHLSFKPP